MGRSTDPETYQRLDRPVGAMAKEFADGARVEPHSHQRGQLIYATRGVMRINTATSAWAVPPLRAVWIPPRVEHALEMAGAVSMRTLYVAADAVPWLWEDCRVIEVSPLLRELILAVAEEPVDYAIGSRADLMAQLILTELRAAAVVPVQVPMPRDPRLRRICEALLERPESTQTLDDWAERAGASGRTLARLFRVETGLSFGAWRQQARLGEAICRLAEGAPLAEIAHRLGYRSPSAFSAMFRRALGQSPQRYFVDVAGRSIVRPGALS